MSDKIKFEQEYLLRTSPKVLNTMLMTPSGLSDWFADDVNIKGDIYTFIWDGSEEQARLLGKKANEYIKFRWLEDEEEGLATFFEIRFKVDPMTKSVVLYVTAFAYEDELQELMDLWESQIETLKRVLGA